MEYTWIRKEEKEKPRNWTIDYNREQLMAYLEKTKAEHPYKPEIRWRPR